MVLGPWRKTAKEAVGSMGNDTPLAVPPTVLAAVRLFQAALRPGDQSAIDPLREGW